MECLVLGARRYDFEGQDGAPVKGATLYYLTLDADEDEENQRGELPLQISAPLAVYDQLEDLPAFYDIDFKQRPGRGGRPTLQAARVSYARAASFGSTNTPAG